MIIILFGVSCVGKSAVGEKLSEKLRYKFFDLDGEINRRFNITIEQFIKNNPFSHERGRIKGEIISSLISENKDNIVIAVSQIHYPIYFAQFTEMDNVFCIELQDTAEHIFQRLIFTDENDQLWAGGDEYKEKHKEHYMKEIREDIKYMEQVFKLIKKKYFVNNKSIDEVVDDLIDIIQND